MTKEIKHFVTPGQVLKLKTSSKSAIRVLKKGGQKEELLDNVFVIKKGNDVVLKYSDGVEVVLQDYVSECRKDDECVLTIPTKEGGQINLSGAEFDLPSYQDDLLLYAHGDKATLAEMASENSQWSQIVSSIDNPEITYLYTDGSSNNSYFIGGLAAGLAALAGGAAAMGGGKGGGSSSTSPAPAPDTSVKTGGVAITGISTDTGSSARDFVTNDQTLEFHGTLGSTLASGEKVQVSLDGGASWHDAVTTGTAWRFDNTASTMAEGTYNVVARVTNSYGKSSVVATQSVIIDTTGPSASTTIAISGISTDTGPSASDYVTSDNTLEFHGTLGAALQPGEKVQVSLDGGTTWHDAVTTGTAWSFDNTGNTLVDGSYSVMTHVIDQAGNIGQSASQTVVVDTTAPTTGNSVFITTYTDAVSPQTGSFGSGTSTNDPAPVLNGSVSGLGAGDVVQIYDGSTLLGTATVSGSSWTYALSGLTDGSTHTYTAKIEDSAGNIGTASSLFTLTEDQTGPSASTTIAISGISTDTGSSASDFMTNDQTLEFHGTLGAALGVGEKVQVSLDSGSTWADAVAIGSTWSFDNTGNTLADGSYGVMAHVIDQAGNIGQSASQAVTIQHAALSTLAISTAITSNTQMTGSLSNFITKDNSPLMKGTVDSPLLANEVVQISLDNGTTWADATTTNTTWNYEEIGMWRLPALADGVYDMQTRITNKLFDVSGAISHHSLTIDTLAPALTVTSESRASLTGTTEAGLIVTFNDISTGQNLGGVTADSTGHWAFSPITSANPTDWFASQVVNAGDTIKVTAFDFASNTTSETFVVIG